VNHIQRRVFRVFVESGGDLGDDAEVQQLIGCVENQLLLLPPKVRHALEQFWRGGDEVSYDRLAGTPGQCTATPVSKAALQQRVSRGARLLENAVRNRSWGSPPAAARPGNSGPRR